MNACVHSHTKPQTSSKRSRGPGSRIHGSVEDTKLSTNKQHSLSLRICSEVESGQVFELHVFSQEMSQHVAYISFHHTRYVGVATYIVLSPYLVWWNAIRTTHDAMLHSALWYCAPGLERIQHSVHSKSLALKITEHSVLSK